MNYSLRRINVFFILMTLSACSTYAYASEGVLHNSIYVALGVSALSNTATKTVTNISTQQVPGAEPDLINYRNTKINSFYQPQFAVGYGWWLDPHWQVTTGLAVSTFSTKVDGQRLTQQYHHDLTGQQLLAQAQVRYWWFENVALVSEFSAGVVQLKAEGFDISQGDSFSDSRKSQFSYGLGLGAMYQFNSHIGVAALADYQDLGSVGMPVKAAMSNATTVGNLEQKLSVLGAKLVLTYQF